MGSIRQSTRAASAEVGTPQLATVVGFAAVSGGTTQVDLSWTDSADESYYLIERSVDSGATYASHATVAGGSTSYNDTQLSTATRYDYRITAFDNLQTSSAWAEANATTDVALAPQTGLVSHWQGSTFDVGDDEWDGVNVPTDRFLKIAGTAASVVSDWEGTGFPAVSFAAGAKYEVQLPAQYDGLAPGTTASVRGSLYVVFSTDETGGQEIIRFEDAAVPASNIRVASDSAEDIVWISDRGVGTATLNIGGPFTVGGLVVFGFSRALDGSDLKGQLNNEALVAGSVDATGSDGENLDNFIIGEDGLAIQIAEIMFYDGNTTNLDLAHHDSVMLYLNSKYGNF